VTPSQRQEGHQPEDAEIRVQLAEAVETLRAIRAGEVDALVVAEGSPGHQVFTLASADRPYRMFVETMRDGAATVSEEGIVLYANRRMSDLLSRPLSRIIGTRLTSFVAEGDHAALAAQDGRAEIRDLVEIELVDGEGGRVPVQVGASTLDVGAERCACLTFADLTQLKRDQEALNLAHEKAMQASGLKAEFVANMSHEIRTPLNGVIAMAGLLLETDLDTDQRQYAHAMRTSGMTLMSMVDEILDFSNVEAGGLQLEQAPFDLSAVIEEACTAVAAPDEGVELLRWIDEGLPATVSGDGARICQVLTHLMSNAVKFTAGGQIRVQVTEGREAGASSIRFEVSDTGIGIDAGAVDGIFESFSQADGSTTREYGGTGLGLAISKQLVELMGGEIGVRSSRGEGSTFWFTVPLPAAQPAAPRHRPRREPADDHEGHRVLLAEDNEINQLVAVRMLEKHGFRVDVAVNGRVALEMCRDHDYSAVFMDCQMPELDGYETSREIRRRESPGCHIPIIAMTANTMEGDREKCLAAGMDEYVGKPIDAEALRHAIDRAMGGEDGRPGDEHDAEVRLPQEGSTPWLDLSVLDEVGDAQMNQDLAGLFAEQSNAYLANMARAIESGDAEALQDHAHELKASSAGVGALRMAELCDGLCRTGRAEVLSDAPMRLRELERAARMTQAAWHQAHSTSPLNAGAEHAISPN
jgi:PAS domain S-box-containing protein